MDEKWFINRDHTLAAWDEYIPCNSWSGQRQISDTLTYRIDILGKHKPGSYGLKPFRWKARLCFNGLWFEVPSSHPSCKSIEDACRLADLALTDKVFENACHFFTSRQFTCCIVDKHTQPFFTSFGPPQWFTPSYLYPKQNYPTGQYYYASRFKDKINFGQMRVDHWGYGGGGTDVRFAHWLEVENQNATSTLKTALKGKLESEVTQNTK